MISVALCTFNGEKYIEEQLDSIVNQTRPVDEIIISDDCSNDSTKELIDGYVKSCHIPIFYYENKINCGVTKNFENALSKCKGDIIFLSDQDDIWEKNKVEKMVAIFENNADCKLVFTDAVLIDSDGNKLNYSLWDRVGIKPQEAYNVKDFLGKRFVTGATVAFRHDILDKALPIPECWIHDAWLAINASIEPGAIIAYKEKLIKYRQHESNVIGAEVRSLSEQIKYTKKNIHNSMYFRNKMRNRFVSFYEHNIDKLTDNDKESIQLCIRFWNDISNVSGLGLFKGFYTIVLNLINGNYKLYNNGLKGAMVDMFILYHSLMKMM